MVILFYNLILGYYMKTNQISSKHLTIRFLEEKIRMCREKGIENVSYTLKIGNPTDEIVNAAEELDADITVMASSRISSLINVLGSTARKVMDSTKRPVLIVH